MLRGSLLARAAPRVQLARPAAEQWLGARALCTTRNCDDPPPKPADRFADADAGAVAADGAAAEPAARAPAVNLFAEVRSAGRGRGRPATPAVPATPPPLPTVPPVPRRADGPRYARVGGASAERAPAAARRERTPRGPAAGPAGGDGAARPARARSPPAQPSVQPETPAGAPAGAAAAAAEPPPPPPPPPLDFEAADQRRRARAPAAPEPSTFAPPPPPSAAAAAAAAARPITAEVEALLASLRAGGDGAPRAPPDPLALSGADGAAAGGEGGGARGSLSHMLDELTAAYDRATPRARRRADGAPAPDGGGVVGGVNGGDGEAGVDLPRIVRVLDALAEATADVVRGGGGGPAGPGAHGGAESPGGPGGRLPPLDVSLLPDSEALRLSALVRRLPEQPPRAPSGRRTSAVALLARGETLRPAARAELAGRSADLLLAQDLAWSGVVGALTAEALAADSALALALLDFVHAADVPAAAPAAPPARAAAGAPAAAAAAGAGGVSAFVGALRGLDAPGRTPRAEQPTTAAGATAAAAAAAAAGGSPRLAHALCAAADAAEAAIAAGAALPPLPPLARALADAARAAGAGAAPAAARAARAAADAADAADAAAAAAAAGRALDGAGHGGALDEARAALRADAGKLRPQFERLLALARAKAARVDAAGGGAAAADAAAPTAAIAAALGALGEGGRRAEARPLARAEVALRRESTRYLLEAAAGVRAQLPAAAAAAAARADGGGAAGAAALPLSGAEAWAPAAGSAGARALAQLAGRTSAALAGALDAAELAAAAGPAAASALQAPALAASAASASPARVLEWFDETLPRWTAAHQAISPAVAVPAELRAWPYPAHRFAAHVVVGSVLRIAPPAARPEGDAGGGRVPASEWLWSQLAAAAARTRRSGGAVQNWRADEVAGWLQGAGLADETCEAARSTGAYGQMLLSQAQLRKLRPKAADAEASDAAAAADADDGAQLRERLAIQSASQRKRFTLALRALRADVDALAFISPRWFEPAPAEAAAEAAGAAAAALPLPELEVTVLQQPRVRVTAAGYARHSLTLELTDKEWKAMRVAASAARGERVAAEARDAAEAVGSALVAKELARVQALLELSDEQTRKLEPAVSALALSDRHTLAEKREMAERVGKELRADPALTALLSQKGSKWANFFGGYAAQDDGAETGNERTAR